jgi:UDP-2-acetamido-3-amino-2,3-dideoxy-glucuronate N-acetyltransferase
MRLAPPSCPPLIWSAQFGHSADSVLLVLASFPYVEEDYIREYEDFLMLAAR